MSIQYQSTRPKPGDNRITLFNKLLQRLGGKPFAGDSENKVLERILNLLMGFTAMPGREGNALVADILSALGQGFGGAIWSPASVEVGGIAAGQIIFTDGNGGTLFRYEGNSVGLFTSLDLSKIVSIVGGTAQNLYVHDNSDLTSVNLSGLVSPGDSVRVESNAQLNSINLQSLVDCPNLTILDNPGLVSLTLPVFRGDGAGSYCQIFLNPGLVNLSIPQFTPANGMAYDFSGNALSAVSVNSILARAVLSGITSATISLDGGTNSAPTGQGIADKATLIGAGNTITTN